MGEEKFYVLEWNIDNFSHWDSEIHEKMIVSQRLSTNPQYTIELYPRGLSGKEEHVEVRLCSSVPAIFTGVVSIIGSDGSILCTLEAKPKSRDLEVLHFTPGPNFEEVVTEIRKNKILKSDRLTLQYRFSCGPDNIVDYMCTTIDVMDISLKVSSDVLQNSNLRTAYSRLYYPLNEGEMGYVILLIENYKPNQSKILLTLSPNNFVKKFSILTRMTVLNNKDEVRTEENKHTFQNDASWTFSNSLSNEELEENGYSIILDFKITPSIGYKQSFRVNLHNTIDVLTVPRFRHSGRNVCEEACNKTSTALASSQTGNSATMLSIELMNLYQGQEFSDFKLKCGDVSFPVHKNILSARSPVFKTMLSADMKEAVSGCMDIEGLDGSTLTRFLAFLYTGKVEDLQFDSALKLYYSADKYQVPSLKRECADFLSVNVSVSNVCDVLSLADTHKDDELLSGVHDFFLKNFNQVLGSEEWKSFMSREPLLAVKTVTHIGEKI